MMEYPLGITFSILTSIVASLVYGSASLLPSNLAIFICAVLTAIWIHIGRRVVFALDLAYKVRRRDFEKPNEEAARGTGMPLDA